MSRLKSIGVPFEVLAIALIIVGGMTDRTTLVVVGILIAIPAVAVQILAFLPRGRQAAKAHRESGGPDVLSEAAAASEEYAATVMSIENTDKVIGADRFGTEMVVDVERDGSIARGLVRDYLTPAQIASLPPGTSIRVKAVPMRTGRYVLVPDDDRSM